MREGSGLSGLLTGIGVGAALVLASPLAASDPPRSSHGSGHEAKAEQHGGAHQAGGESHGTGRWSPYHQNVPHSEPAAANSAAAPEVAQGCAYFENAGYAGRRGDLNGGGNVEWVGRRWDNRISAVACHAGCRLLAYPDINFGGTRRVLTGAVPDVGPGWNDRISSVRVICESGTAAH